MEHSTEILYNKTEVYCSTVHRFGSDALLLARFCEPRRSQKAAPPLHSLHIRGNKIKYCVPIDIAQRVDSLAVARTVGGQLGLVVTGFCVV